MNKISVMDPNAQQPAHALLAGLDTLYFSFEAEVSEAMLTCLDVEKEAVALAARENAVHCPDWLGARMLPNGSRGGYRILIETEGFSVKVLGAGIRNRPGLYVEMRSLFLHSHPNGSAGACKAASAWVREHLLCDQEAETAARLVSFKAAKLSRADLHIDWQGGYTPCLDSASDELRRFIRIHEGYIKVFGKGRKEREVGVSPTTAKFIWKYVYQHRAEADDTVKDLFTGIAGKPLTLWGVEQILQRNKEASGITDIPVTAHNFRHTFARTWLERGGEVYSLSRLMGHSSVKITEIYLEDFKSRQARTQHAKFSPINNLKLRQKGRGNHTYRHEPRLGGGNEEAEEKGVGGR